MNKLLVNAIEARKYFISKNTATGSLWLLSDSRPKWVFDMIMEAHGDMLPDDYKYGYVVDSLDVIIENEGDDEVSLESDVYTAELTAWLHSRVDRIEYCDQALEDMGPKSFFDLLSYAQFIEKNEVLASVISSLREKD